jgi:3-isopropylmalate/(R)-2-methylmalate dehydratase small subunit
VRTRFEGRVWVFDDNISTDHIIAGAYLGSTDPKVFAAHAMEAENPDFAKAVRPGDILVAGANFGCGSSREQAPRALKTLGVAAILADSFARIFFRNSINIGLPVLECPGLRARVREGERIRIDLTEGEVRTASGDVIRFVPLPPNVLAILEAGGLVAKLRAELAPKA